MKLKYLFFVCVTSCAIVLGGCGKSGEKSGNTTKPTEAPAAVITESPEEKPEEYDNTGESVEDRAIAAYNEYLENAPALGAGDQEDLNNYYMDYEQNLVRFGEHYDTYLFYDINKDGVSELIATTKINLKRRLVYVFTYADEKVVLLNDPMAPDSQGTFDQNSGANGICSLLLCDDNHIHNVWTGMNAIDEEVTDDFAYLLEGAELKYVECAVSEGDGIVNFDDIASANPFVRADSQVEPEVVRNVEIDYYKVPELYSKVITEEEMAVYKKVVEAWLNYEPKVQVDNPSGQNMLWGMIKESFFLVYGDFDEEKGFSYDDQYIYFPYVSTSKEEHDAIIAAFEERVKSFYTGIGDDEEGIELAKHIYTNFNRTLAYSYDLMDESKTTLKNTSGYAAIMEGSGVCMSFSKAYTYLARQAGLETFSVVGLAGSEEIENHEWGAIKVGDKYYFIDPTWDYINNPDNYIYFCFGMDKRISNGYPESQMTLAVNGDCKLSDTVTIEREDLSY